MDTRTRANLMTALHDEAFAYARCMLMATEAREEGDLEAANLLEGIAGVGLREHFAELARLAHLVGGDADNLVTLIQDESTRRETTYRRFAEQARAAGESEVAECFERIRADERDDVTALERAVEHLEVPT
jgi:rubrerythrin